MGWSIMSSPWWTKPRLVADLVSPSYWKGAQVQPRRHSVVGNHLWILFDRVSGEGSAQEVGLYALSAPHPVERGGWGYKDLPPREFLDCPAYMLEADLCPEYYGEWIAQVKREREEAKQLDRRLEALSPGDGVTMYGRQFELVQRVRGGWDVQEITKGSDRKIYKATLSQLREGLASADSVQPPPVQTVAPATQGVLV